MIGENAVSDANPESQIPQPTLVMTLVHGTWGRGILVPRERARRPRWFDEQSRFRSRLEDMLVKRGERLKVESLYWSGANSLKAREQAALSLAQNIVQLCDEYPGTQQVVIGHSHGGNVALRAMAHLPDHIQSPFIVTIATPFVTVESSSRPLWSEATALAGMFLSLALLSSLIYLSFDQRSFLNTTANYLTLVRDNWMLNVVAGLTFPAAWYYFCARLLPRIIQIFLSSDDPEAITSHKAFVERAPRTLVVRAIDDEASLVLSLGAIITRVSRAAIHLLSLCILIGLPATAAGFLFFFMPGVEISRAFDFTSDCLRILYYDNLEFSPADIAFIRQDYPRQCTRDIIRFTMATSPIILTGVLLLLAAGLSVFGREMFRHSFFYEVNSSSAPDNEGNVTVRTVGSIEEKWGLRHMLYDTWECVFAINRWLGRELDHCRLISSVPQSAASSSPPLHTPASAPPPGRT